MELYFNDFSMGLLALQFFLLLTLALFLFAIVSIVKNEFKNNDKLIWILIILFLPIFGSVLYFFIGRKTKIDKKQI